jgi:alginate O-acetyltransferase complex protein AlgJ
MLAATQSQLYYRTDTHWNQNGAQLAAKEITKVIAALNLSMEKTPFKTTQNPEAQPRSGDLLRLMGLENMAPAFRPKPDLEAVATTQLLDSPAPAASLFGDIAIPVVLTGTSYSLRGNFHGYLQEALNSKVLNTAKDGGGFLQGMTGYLNDDSFKSSKPQVLVWELPERMLQNPITDEAQWFTKIQPLLQ